jgi:hypothetical protein
VRETVRLKGHLPELDPLRQLPPDDESVEMAVAVDVDPGMFQTTDGQWRALAAEGIREKADFTLDVPDWRRLYVLANDGESVAVADGDAMAGETAWAAVYRQGDLVAALTEDQQGDDDSGLL